MNCENYQQLTPLEKMEYIGRLVHGCQSDNALFSIGKEIVNLGEKKGLFEGLVINPEPIDEMPIIDKEN